MRPIRNGLEKDRTFTGLFLFKKPGFGVVKATDEEVNAADPKDQARLVCSMLAGQVPSGVVKTFCEMTGADYETILRIGVGRKSNNQIPAYAPGRKHV
jgi:hypothetical protein